jgi:hypothetical protein
LDENSGICIQPKFGRRFWYLYPKKVWKKIPEFSSIQKLDIYSGICIQSSTITKITKIGNLFRNLYPKIPELLSE